MTWAPNGLLSEAEPTLVLALDGEVRAGLRSLADRSSGAPRTAVEPERRRKEAGPDFAVQGEYTPPG